MVRCIVKRGQVVLRETIMASCVFTSVIIKSRGNRIQIAYYDIPGTYVCTAEWQHEISSEYRT
jgi:hypothetical protein